MSTRFSLAAGSIKAHEKSSSARQNTVEAGLLANANALDDDVDRLEQALGIAADAVEVAINYSSNNFVTDGTDPITAIGALDAALAGVGSSGTLIADTIIEKTAAHGVIADSVTLKDGIVTQTGDPSSALQCATKQYVDAGLAAITGALKSYQFFTTGTAATYTRPAGIAKGIVVSTGGGGGGGGCGSNIGAGGGGGGCSISIMHSLGATETYTVGAAGAAGSSTGPTDGGAGGDTSFGSFCIAKGGAGGTAGAESVTAGGAGGLASGGTGDIKLSGETGNYGTAGNAGTDAGSGDGGAAAGPLGGKGGRAPSASGAGATGLTYGGGGSGGTGSTGSNGGAGAAGCILVLEFT